MVLWCFQLVCSFICSQTGEHDRENLEMSGILTAVREMSGILLKVREVSGEKSCQGKVA